MERPPAASFRRGGRQAALRPVQVADNSTLELLFAANAHSVAPASQQGSLYRIKRRRDEPLEAIVLESTTAKKATIASISQSLGALSTNESSPAPAPTAATAPPSSSTTSSVPVRSSGSANTKKPSKVFRRVETISGRVASERGLMAIVESIRRHKEENTARQKAASRKQATSRQAREKVLESNRQLSTDNSKVPSFPLPASLGSTSRPPPLTQEEIMRNYMPLVRKFLNTEREKEVAAVARKDAEDLDAELDEYSVEIFAESEENADLPEGQAVRVKVEPFDFDPANEYASDEENSDPDSEDTNDEDHPNNEYPDRDEDAEEEGNGKKTSRGLFDEDEEDEDSEVEEDDNDLQSSDEEDLAWAPGPPKYRAYHSAAASDDDDDD